MSSSLHWNKGLHPSDARYGNLLLHIQMEPWVSPLPCVLFGWWFSPCELWLVDIVVLPMGSQTPSAPTVLALTSPLVFQHSVQCSAVNISICIDSALVETLRGLLYQAPVSKYFLATVIVSGFGVSRWDRSPGGAVCGWPFLQFLSHSMTLHYPLTGGILD